MKLPIPSTGWLIGIAALAGFAAAWTAQGWHYGEIVADMKLEASEAALGSAIAARDKTRTLQAKVVAIDTQKTKELNHAKAEIERMRAAVAAGTGRLSLHAYCPKLPGLTLDTGLGDGAAPRLTDAAQRNYFLLRERAILCTKQVEVLQGYVRIVQGQGSD